MSLMPKHFIGIQLPTRDADLRSALRTHRQPSVSKASVGMSLVRRGAIIAAVLAVAAILIWQAIAVGGVPDPTAPNTPLGSAVLDIGVLVFREGLECILVLAAITASMIGSSESYRRPIAAGVGLAFLTRSEEHTSEL